MRAASLPRAAREGVRALAAAEWEEVGTSLDAVGFAVVPRLLDAEVCARIRAWYGQSRLFRSRVVMARHGFGQGEYQYFAYPLPALVDGLRQQLYKHLAPVANAWSKALGVETRYPPELEAFLTHCRAKGQSRPTPLMLRYGVGDYNRLHQDLYGGVQFPLQAAILLDAPERDFDGGEFVLTESAPRSQSRAHVVPLAQGDMVIFAVNQRPVPSTKGFKRVVMRHGVSTIRSGSRTTLGIILHDAA